MKTFDPTQDLPQGTTLIEASAGTGKTWTITGLVLRLMLEEDLRIQDVLIVTFTEAATAELQDRVRKRIREALQRLRSGEKTDDALLEHIAAKTATDREQATRRLRTALNDFDRASISTIHGFCKRMLEENAFESGALFDTELVGDQTELLESIVLDFWASRMGSAHPAVVRHAQTVRFNPARLLRLAERVAAEPGLDVLPDRSDLPAPSDAALVDAFQTLRVAWAAGRNELASLLERDRSSWEYRLNNLATKLGGVDEWLTPTRPENGPPWQLRAFRKESIAEHIRVPDHPLLDAVQAFYEAWNNETGALDEHLIELQLEFREHLLVELPKRKAESRTWSFDDLLLELDRALDPEKPASERLAAAIRRRYKAALIDEFQDTDPVQYRIFQRVFRDGGGWLFLIGDPKQAIYGFRGADIFAYGDAKKDAGERCYTLSVNYRSDPALIAGLNALFGTLTNPFAQDFIDYPMVSARPDAIERLDDGRPAVIIRGCDDYALKGKQQKKGKRLYRDDIERSLPRHVSADIARLLHSGAEIDGERILPGDVAVLVRTNAQAESVQTALRLRGIPSVLHGASSVLKSHEAGELERFMAGVAEPARTTLLRTALASDLLGLRAADIAALDENDSSGWDGWVERFRTWRTLWDRQSFARMFRSVLEDMKVQHRLLGTPDGERRMTNILHLVEFVHTAAVDQQLGIAGLLRWYRAQRQDATPADVLSLRLESDARAVQLITIHKAKGLEYPVVFAPYLWTSWMKDARSEPILRFHHLGREGSPRMIDLGSEDKSKHLRWYNDEEKAENLRLQYVALTRAKHRAYLYLVPGYRNFDDSPLSYLLLQPSPVLPTETLAETRRRTADLGIQGVMDAAEASVDRLPDSVAFERVQGLDATGVPPWGPQQDDDWSLGARIASRQLDGSWRTSSFSSLKGDRPPTALGPLAEGRDHDHETPAVETIHAGEPIPLAEFPRGAKAGNFFHDVFEHLDFTAPVDRDLVRRMLILHGYDDEPWVEPVSEFFQTVVDTPFHTDGLRLRDLIPSSRLNELEFVFPVRHGLRACDPQDRMRPQQLAQVFRDHGSAHLPSDYADRIEDLEFEPLHGFLKGFIDLSFLHDGRWFVVDYKSNHVGDTLGAYSEPELAHPMAHGHYILQYHLYTLALHRFLKTRLVDYDYERDFGGSTYLFIKGMDPRLGASHGAFRDRPSLAMVEALDAVMGRA